MATVSSVFQHKILKIIFSLYIASFLLIWAISSPLIKHYIKPILTEHNLRLNDESSIRFNPFLMRITLTDINLSSTKNTTPETVFALKELTLQVALWQLAFDKIVLSKFLLKQGTLKITQHDNLLVIAGIKTPYLDREINKTTEQTTQESDDAPSHVFPYQIVLPNFLLSQFHIEIERHTLQQSNKTHHIEIEQLTLNQVKATKMSQEGNLTLTALIDKTHFTLAAKAQLTAGKGDIHSNIRLDNYPIEKLSRYVEQLTELKGLLSFTSQQTVTFTEQGVNLSVQKAGLTLQDLLMGLNQQQLSLANLQYNVTELAVNIQSNAITHLAGKSSIKLSDAVFHYNKSKAKIAAFKQLNVDDIRFTLDEEPSIDIANVVLDEFLFSKKVTLTDATAQKAMAKINELSAEYDLDIAAEAMVKLPPVIKLKQLTVSKLHIHENSIAVNAIVFESLNGEVIINENKKITNLVGLIDAANEEEIDANAEQIAANKAEPLPSNTDSTDNTFIFSFKTLRFINENTFNFTDFSVDPIYQRTLFLDTFDIGALSNSKEKQQEKTSFTFTGRSNKYANFNFTGFIQPFATIENYQLKGDLKELSLPAISSYMKKSAGIEIKTGQLNTALDITLTGEELKGNIVVLLQGLQTGLVNSDEAGSLIDQGALPLNMAMSMLKDSDGNVELDVPISGSTSDPNFGLHSIITLITQKAIISATQNYLIATFVPYGNIVSIVVTAGQFAVKLRFDDLPYQVKQIEPNEQQQKYLQQLIALMQDKKNTHVSICAISIPADIGLKSGIEVANKKDIKRLKSLGEQREHALKDYLIEQGDISSSRILFCKPQIDNNNGALPRIAISV